jgi:hypothetical protein
MAVWRGTAAVSGASGRVGSVVFARSGGRQTVRACCRGRGFTVERRALDATGSGDVIVARSVSWKRARDRWALLSADARTWWSKHFGGESGGRQAYVLWWSRTDAWYCQYGMENPYTGAPHLIQATRSGMFANVEINASGGSLFRVYWNAWDVIYPFVDVWVRRCLRRGHVGGVRTWCGVQYVWDSGWYDWTAWIAGSPRDMVFQTGEVVRVELQTHHHWYTSPGVLQSFDAEVT